MDNWHNFNKFNANEFLTRNDRLNERRSMKRMEELKLNPPCFVFGCDTHTFWTLEVGGVVSLCETCG